MGKKSVRNKTFLYCSGSSIDSIPPSTTTPPAPSGGKKSPSPGVCLGPRLSLVLRGPNLPDVEDIEVDLADSNWTIFRAIQKIIQVCYSSLLYY